MIGGRCTTLAEHSALRKIAAAAAEFKTEDSVDVADELDESTDAAAAAEERELVGVS